MYGLTIDISDKVSPNLLKLAETLHGDSLKSAAGGGARRLLQQHFRQLDDSRANTMGGKRTHFYAAAARSTSYAVDSDGVTVSIHSVGIAQRFYGGEIKPVNGKALTIPACAEAYGRRAGEFNNLELIWPKGHSVGMLVERQSQEVTFKKRSKKKVKSWEMTSVGRTVKGGKIFFWLVSKVTQDADPSVLPDSSLLNDAATLAMLNYIGENK